MKTLVTKRDAKPRKSKKCSYCGRKYRFLDLGNGKFVDPNHGACKRPSCVRQAMEDML